MRLDGQPVSQLVGQPIDKYEKRHMQTFFYPVHPINPVPAANASFLRVLNTINTFLPIETVKQACMKLSSQCIF